MRKERGIVRGDLRNVAVNGASRQTDMAFPLLTIISSHRGRAESTTDQTPIVRIQSGFDIALALDFIGSHVAPAFPISSAYAPWLESLARGIHSPAPARVRATSAAFSRHWMRRIQWESVLRPVRKAASIRATPNARIDIQPCFGCTYRVFASGIRAG